MKKAKRAGSRTRAEKLVTREGALHVEGRGAGKVLGHLRANRSLLLPAKNEKSRYAEAFGSVSKEGPTSRVASMLRRSHDKGDGRATYALASWYIHGVVFERNATKAAKLLRIAVKRGVGEAMYDLAYSYEIGFGVPKSNAKALAFYIAAAQKGDKQALNEVIRCIYYGVGILKNRELAFLIRDVSNCPA